jgi:hypothetical protein
MIKRMLQFISSIFADDDFSVADMTTEDRRMVLLQMHIDVATPTRGQK